MSPSGFRWFVVALAVALAAWRALARDFGRAGALLLLAVVLGASTLVM
jgi:hypothetical protein